ncbi:hypothetical protein GCM10012283_21260 [Phycicoccus endophyticus]|nr:hypothetical protein GCM10012283_21260 [Phycicoccus endophyticus]
MCPWSQPGPNPHNASVTCWNGCQRVPPGRPDGKGEQMSDYPTEGPADSGAGEPGIPGEHDGGADGGADASA